MVFQLVPPQPPPPQPPKIKSSDSDGSGLVIIFFCCWVASDYRADFRFAHEGWSDPVAIKAGGPRVGWPACPKHRARGFSAKHARKTQRRKNGPIFSQCKVLAIRGGRGGTSDVCSGDGRRGRYHTDGRMKRRHILVKVCVHLANKNASELRGFGFVVETLVLEFRRFYFRRWSTKMLSRASHESAKL